MTSATAAERGSSPILEVRGLRTSFYTRAGVIRAVTGVDFSVARNEVLGLVGESGCGKVGDVALHPAASSRLPDGWRPARSSSTAATC